MGVRVRVGCAVDVGLGFSGVGVSKAGVAGARVALDCQVVSGCASRVGANKVGKYPVGAGVGRSGPSKPLQPLNRMAIKNHHPLIFIQFIRRLLEGCFWVRIFSEQSDLLVCSMPSCFQ